MPTITRTEYIEVNGVVFATPAWEALDLSSLYDAPSVRGGDRLIPFKPGEQPLPRVVGPFQAIIPILVMGEKDQDGDAYSDRHLGLIANMDYLREQVWTPNPSGDGTVPVVWHRPDGSEGTADGMVIPPMDPDDQDPGMMLITMDLRIPGGGFVFSGS